MKITTLIEDTAGACGYLYEHGLSFYIETPHHKVLLDTGASDAFIKNAEKKGIDLSLVDTVVISHGHYDHTGGLAAFAALNKSAKIYIHKKAFGAFYNLKNGNEKYIGMPQGIAALSNIVLADGDVAIDDELFLFCGVARRRLHPRGNATLKEKRGDIFVQDEFCHEQYLVVTEGEKRVFLSGCAHNGILGILDAYRERFGGAPTLVLSGFHTTKQEYTAEDDALIESTANELLKMPTCFFTGHCTGEHPLGIFKRIMGEKLTVLHSGDEII